MTARHTGAEATMRAVAPAGIRSGKFMRETAIDLYGADRAAAGRHGDSGMRSQARRWIPKSEALAIDYGQRRVTVAGRAVALTATEYELLRVLSLTVGRVVPQASRPRPGATRAYAPSLRPGAGLWQSPAGSS